MEIGESKIINSGLKNKQYWSFSKSQLFKKTLCIIGIICCNCSFFSQSLNKLIEFTIQNNPDILSAENIYKSSVLSSKTLNGIYSPQLTFSSSSSLPDAYDLNATPDYFSTTVTFTQPLPGESALSITSSVDLSAVNFLEDRYISQSLNICFSLSQSLLPFWIQGKIRNPTQLSANQQKEYYYNQLLFTKKNVLQNLVQNYANALINKNQIRIYQNYINLLDAQIEVSKDLKATGEISQSKITELQNSKWNYLQDLISVQASYISYIQNLKTICGVNFEDDIQFDLPEDLVLTILANIDNISDPLKKAYQLKIEILKSKHIIEKQSSAPTLSFTIQPKWTLESKKQDEWKEAWKNLNSPSSWAITVNINPSPLLYATINQNKKQYQLDYNSAENSYNTYIVQKNFVLQQYQTIFEQYKLQLETVTNLYNEGISELEDLEIQYKAGAISKLDYDSVRIKVENCRLSKENIDIYLWLYNFLIKSYK